MREALQGKSGTLVGQDYRGEIVLAAYEPVKELNYGIVAKIDLAEVRAPFVRAGAIALGFMVLVVFAGAMSFLRITKPMIKRLENQANELQKAHDKLENRVEERTKELSRANRLLTQEITERKKTGEALKQSEDELRRLSSKLLTAHEEASKRIGQELHDGLAQTLSAVKIWAENAIIQLGQKDSVEAAKSFESVVSLAQGAVEEVRRISRNLRPSSLDDLGVLATISGSCQEFCTLYAEIEIEEQIEIEEDQVPDSLKIVIYRVLQEALNNIAKHSRANLVRFSLKAAGGMIEMIIDDNGEGFEMEHILPDQRSDRGLGIASMKERTELSGGSFLIESHRGAGTTVRASWPLT
jgi:signal transduction histidine kinase